MLIQDNLKFLKCFVSGAYLEERHPYISHFGSSNRGAWQNTQIFPSPSPIPNLPPKQIDEIENNIASTIAPPCDVGLFSFHKFPLYNGAKSLQISSEQRYISKNKEVKKTTQQGEKHIAHEKEIDQNNAKENTLKIETPKLNHANGKEPKGTLMNNIFLQIFFTNYVTYIFLLYRT